MIPYHPPAEISLAVVEWRDLFLLTLRGSAEDDPIWAFPSVHLEPGEDVLQGAARAAHEQTSILVQPFNLIGTRHHANSDRTVHYVACQHKDGEPCRMDVDTLQEVKWVSPAEALQLLLPPLFGKLEEHLDLARRRPAPSLSL